MNSLVIGGAAAGLVAGLGHVQWCCRSCPRTRHSPRLQDSRPLPSVCALGTSVLTVATLLDYVFQAERRAHYVGLRGATFGVLKLALLTASDPPRRREPGLGS